MPDREKVIKELEHYIMLCADVRNLLKEQFDKDIIVRCKDCKNSGLDSSGINGYWCSAHTEWHEGDWFCADGDRK